MADIELNWLDRAAGWLSPRWQANRLHARTAVAQSEIWRSEAMRLRDQMREFNMTYRGGVQTRLDKPWTQNAFGVTVQTQAERTSLFSMRERARKVDAENPIGHGMLDRLVDNVIGDGFTLQARTESKEFNKEAEEKWQRFWEAPEVTGLFTGPDLERITYREHERDGDVGWILVSKGNRSRLQLVRSNQICTPDTKHQMPAGTVGAVVDGIELGPLNDPIAFHVLNGDENGQRKWARILAKDFIFLPRIVRGNQVRGEPCFAQVFGLLDQVDGYVDAVVIAARMAAVFGLIFRKSAGVGQTLAALPSVTNSQGHDQRALTLENGSLSYIGEKDEVAQVQAVQPMQQTPDFIRAMLRLIGLPMDMPLELVLMDFSEPNFAAAKANLLQFYRAMTPRQNRFRSMAMSRCYRWWISREIKNNAFKNAPPQDSWPHEFLPHEWTWVDPIEQMQGALLEMNAGLNSRQRLAKKLGRDPEELIEEQKQDLADRKGLPVIHSSLTRDPTPEKPANANANSDRS